VIHHFKHNRVANPKTKSRNLRAQANNFGDGPNLAFSKVVADFRPKVAREAYKIKSKQHQAEHDAIGLIPYMLAGPKGWASGGLDNQRHQARDEHHFEHDDAGEARPRRQKRRVERCQGRPLKAS
jgi:hypothetical protein